MTKDEALKMAIEALDTLMMEKGSIYQQALNACKEALEQPIKESLITEQELLGAEFEKVLFDNLNELYESEENPAQEPVAYQPTSQEQSVMHRAMINSSKKIEPYKFIHPYYGNLTEMLLPKNELIAPQWQGLTDDEIDSAWNEVTKYGISGVDFTVRFARAIEQALKEKNEK